jgi:glycine/D-amino acid oxidase-like deaminating enzyme
MKRVTIVGCGIIGATIAYELSCLEGFDITVLDRQPPAQDSTGAALGVLMGVISQKVKGHAWHLREYSIRRYHQLIPELELKTGLTIPHNRQGIIKLLSADEDLSKYQQLADTRSQQGWKLELWNQSAIHEGLPQVGGVNIHSAIYSPQDLQVQPIALTNALVAAARLQGVNFHFDREVMSIESSSPHSWQINSSRGVMTADTIAIAAGLGSTPLTQTLQHPIALRPVLGQATHYRLPHRLGHPEFQPVITYDDVHIVPWGEGEYWVGATVEFTPEISNEIQPDPELLAQVKQKAIAFCPGLESGEIIRTWSGLRPRPEQRPAPVIEQLQDGLLVATGHYRNGVLLAPVTAQLVLEIINN